MVMMSASQRSLLRPKKVLAVSFPSQQAASLMSLARFPSSLLLLNLFLSLRPNDVLLQQAAE
jgi:hypothetical protein